MMHDRFDASSPWHPMGCRCSDCTPPGPANPPRHEALYTTVMIVAGLLVGLLADAAIGWIAHGPSILQALGWAR